MVIRIVSRVATVGSFRHKTIAIIKIYATPLRGMRVWLLCDQEGKNHGRRSRGGRGGQVPPEFGVGGCPPDFVMLQNFTHQITCITM